MQQEIVVDQVSRIYGGGTPVTSLDRVSFSVDAGEFLAVVGPSGSGKTTLMNLLGCMDSPTAGRILLGGVNIVGQSERKTVAIRRSIGFVFQQFLLVDTLSAEENVALPLYYRGVPAHKRRALAREALSAVGLGERLSHLPRELSGGQQQRVALARAMVTRPAIVLADEPTGNLDPAAGEEVMRLLRGLCDRGVTVVVITHDRRIAEEAPRRLVLENGRLVADERSSAAE